MSTDLVVALLSCDGAVLEEQHSLVFRDGLDSHPFYMYLPLLTGAVVTFQQHKLFNAKFFGEFDDVLVATEVSLSFDFLAGFWGGQAFHPFHY